MTKAKIGPIYRSYQYLLVPLIMPYVKKKISIKITIKSNQGSIDQAKSLIRAKENYIIFSTFSLKVNLDMIASFAIILLKNWIDLEGVIFYSSFFLLKFKNTLGGQFADRV